MSRLSSAAIDTLRSHLSGRVIAPADADYDALRAIFLGGFEDRRPALVARPADAADVARVISAARDHDLPLAVRCGGHSSAGHSITDGGIVLDLRDLKGIDIDAGARTASAGAGMTAGEYTIATGVHQLATGFGDTGSVGIGGITLGGGVGYLTRRYGMTIDSLLGAEMVTADGLTILASADHHPELFWAIRGGGGNFGVVTRFHFRLHPVHCVLGGVLVLPATPDVIAGTVAAAEAAPESLSAIVNVMPAPPMPFLPADVHGQLVVMVLLCCVGDDDAAAAAVAPFRALATPLADLVRPMTYPEIFPPEDHSLHPVVVGRTMFGRSVDRAAAETMVEFLRASDASMRVVQIRVLGGAMARVPDDATAFAHRRAPMLFYVAAFCDREADRPRRIEWVQSVAAALDQGVSGAYVNFLGDEGDARVRAAYPPAAYERLAAVKARYDPDNVFHLNQNIVPARG